MRAGTALTLNATGWLLVPAVWFLSAGFVCSADLLYDEAGLAAAGTSVWVIPVYQFCKEPVYWFKKCTMIISIAK